MIGFIILVQVSQSPYSFINYLAVDTAYQSKGYGSLMLEQLAALFPEDDFVLEIESTKNIFTATDKKVRRKKFYEKNDFHPASFESQINGVRFEIITTANHLEAKDYLAIYQKAYGDEEADRVIIL